MAAAIVIDEASDSAAFHSTPSETEKNQTSPVMGDTRYSLGNGSSPTIITGHRLQLVVFSLCFALFLSTLETTIVATALVTISSDFGEFNSAGWIVLAYLLTYCGFLVVYARFSDIFGRKNAILVALVFFTLFSLLCGVAQSMKQLIVFRAFQGVGGSGIFSMVFVAIPEIVPPTQFGIVSGLVGAVFASSSIVGPTVGGAITSHTTWRWVFYLNVPCGVVVTAIIAFAYPPHKPLGSVKEVLSRIDWPGVVLSLAGSIVLVFALQEGGLHYPWQSGAIIACLVVAGLCWLAFGFWEVVLTQGRLQIPMVPIFPTRLVKGRVVGAALACAFTSGFPFTVTIVNLPQRLQIVNGKSPVAAGIDILPLLLLSAVGSGVSGAIVSKTNIAFYVLLASNMFEILGTGLLSSLPTSQNMPVQIYPYMAILGIGFGSSVVSLMVVTRTEVDKEDQAVSQGAITQVRVLGGLIGLAVCTAILFQSVKSQLSSILSSEQLFSLLQSTFSIAELSPAQQDATRSVYGDAFNLQMRIVMGFTIGSLCISMFTFRRRPRSLEEAHQQQWDTKANKKEEKKPHEEQRVSPVLRESFSVQN